MTTTKPIWYDKWINDGELKKNAPDDIKQSYREYQRLYLENHFENDINDKLSKEIKKHGSYDNALLAWMKRENKKHRKRKLHEPYKLQELWQYGLQENLHHK